MTSLYPIFPKHFVVFVWFYLERLLWSQKTNNNNLRQGLLFLYVYFLFSIFHSNRLKKRGKESRVLKKPIIFCPKDLIHTVGNKWNHNKALLKIWRESDKRAILFFSNKKKNIRNGIQCILACQGDHDSESCMQKLEPYLYAFRTLLKFILEWTPTTTTCISRRTFSEEAWKGCFMRPATCTRSSQLHRWDGVREETLLVSFPKCASWEHMLGKRMFLSAIRYVVELCVLVYDRIHLYDTYTTEFSQIRKGFCPLACFPWRVLYLQNVRKCTRCRSRNVRAGGQFSPNDLGFPDISGYV